MLNVARLRESELDARAGLLYRDGMETSRQSLYSEVVVHERALVALLRLGHLHKLALLEAGRNLQGFLPGLFLPSPEVVHTQMQGLRIMLAFLNRAAHNAKDGTRLPPHVGRLVVVARGCSNQEALLVDGRAGQRSRRKCPSGRSQEALASHDVQRRRAPPEESVLGCCVC